MVIPIYLLWHVQIKFRQKLALGISFCLSVMMVILAIVRISRFRSDSATIDFTWDIFWQFAESCTAVTMVSFTAFRSLFVAHTTHQSPKKSSYTSWRYPWQEKRQQDAEALHGESQELQALPEQPKPALTGMRTSIRGERTISKGGFLKTKASDGGDEPWPLRDDAGGQGIRVHHTVSMDTEVVSDTPGLSLEIVMNGETDGMIRTDIACWSNARVSEFHLTQAACIEESGPFYVVQGVNCRDMSLIVRWFIFSSASQPTPSLLVIRVDQALSSSCVESGNNANNRIQRASHS